MGQKLVYQPARGEEQKAQDECAPQSMHEAPDGKVRDSGQAGGAGAIPRPLNANSLFRPVKTRVTIRLDADVIESFKAMAGVKGESRGYQTLINQALREYLDANR